VTGGGEELFALFQHDGAKTVLGQKGAVTVLQHHAGLALLLRKSLTDPLAKGAFYRKITLFGGIVHNDCPMTAAGIGASPCQTAETVIIFRNTGDQEGTSLLRNRPK
jgi:hypothetical protein